MMRRLDLTDNERAVLITTLRRLERFWIRAGDFVQRPPQFAA